MVTFLQTYLKFVELDRDTQAVHCLKVDCAAVHTLMISGFLFACLPQECAKSWVLLEGRHLNEVFVMVVRVLSEIQQ